METQRVESRQNGGANGKDVKKPHLLPLRGTSWCTMFPSLLCVPVQHTEKEGEDTHAHAHANLKFKLEQSTGMTSLFVNWSLCRLLEYEYTTSVLVQC